MSRRGTAVLPAGTGALVRLALRRDRVILPTWVLLLGLTAAGTASSFASVYPTAADRRDFARGLAGNGATDALYGPLFGDSVGALTAWRLGGIFAALVGLMAIQAVVRHTRADEETARAELVGAGVVGHLAPLAAALLVAFGASLATGILAALGVAATGRPAAGSLVLGAGFAAVGIAFAAVGAVAAQLPTSSRAANGLGVAGLALAYLLRATGDASGATWLSWLSPLGWSQRTQPFAGDRWWPLLLSLAFAAALGAAAVRLASGRDLGAGLLPDRPGPARAAPGLRSTAALAWRLQRAPLLGWTAGFAVGGAAIGAVAGGIGDLVAGDSAKKLLTELGGEKGIVDAYISTSLGVFGLIAAAYAVQAVLRLRGEETSGRAEPVLATPVGRMAWAAGHVAIAAAGVVVVLAAAGLAAGLAHGLRTGALGTQLPRVLAAALARVPAAWVIAGVALALYGLAPRAASASWGALALCLLLGELGPVLDLSDTVIGISPFAHVPKLPGGAVTAGPLLALAAIAAALGAAGLAGLRRRDLPA
jgi:ABC-2 type transport system permease protein